jgi:hypothetical protein
MNYARVLGFVVQEVFVPPGDLTIEDCFTPQVVVFFEPCPVEVEQNWIKEPDGSFVAPPLPPAPPEPIAPPEPEIKSNIDSSPSTVENL